MVRDTSAAFVKVMIHIIRHPDDAAELERDDARVNAQLPFSLLAKTRWSKNASEEHESPEQILLGVMDPLFCLPITTGAHLELWMESGLGCANDRTLSLEGDVPDNAKDHQWTFEGRHL